MNYKPTIGLETHIELNTQSKMFCACSAEYFGQEPNSHTCPVCLGLPGALPFPNRKAVESCIKIGLALNCKIAIFSKFDRKNYFYPDLPKGYQISQYDLPFCQNGEITINTGTSEKKIRITRVHMEEDTGKLIHAIVGGEKVSLVDFNRSGVPLVEIVTEPDFENEKEVVLYLKKLQQIVRYLGVANADMEKGEMRLEPNISISSNGKMASYKVEVKNINSFRFAEKAIKYEIKRHLEILESGKKPVQETRGWDENKQKTYSQRLKEKAHDYRYFPEPDIPPLTFPRQYVEGLKKLLPEMADEKKKRFVKQYGISEYYADILTRETELADFFEQSVRDGKTQEVLPQTVANEIINKKIDHRKTLPSELIVNLKSNQKYQIIDEKELDKIIEKVLNNNSKAVEDYKKGKKEVIGFLIGMVKKEIRKPIDLNQIKSALEKIL